MYREKGISLNQCITNLILLLNLEALVNIYSTHICQEPPGSILGTKGTAVNKTHKSPHSCVAYILLARDRQETKTNK